MRAALTPLPLATLAALAASALLAGCGGGSGGDSAALGAPAPAAPAALTAANYVAVAQEALSSSSYLASAASLVTGAQVGDASTLVRFGQDQAGKLAGWLNAAPAQAVGVVQTQTEPCWGGGTLTIRASDLNGNGQVDPGDSATLTASNCAYRGETLNGQLSLTVDSLAGDPDTFPYKLAVTLGFGQLSAQSATVRTVGNGNLALSIDARAANDQSLALRTSSLSLSSTYASTRYDKTLSGYASTSTLSPAGSGYTASTTVNGTLSSSAFGAKSVVIETLAPFVSSGQAHPGSGRLLISGAAGSKVRVTATSASALLIELDADGNGTYETATPKGWSELL